jgi:hypothetical protein
MLNNPDSRHEPIQEYNEAIRSIILTISQEKYTQIDQQRRADFNNYSWKPYTRVDTKTLSSTHLRPTTLHVLEQMKAKPQAPPSYGPYLPLPTQPYQTQHSKQRPKDDLASTSSYQTAVKLSQMRAPTFSHAHTEKETTWDTTRANTFFYNLASELATLYKTNLIYSTTSKTRKKGKRGVYHASQDKKYIYIIFDVTFIDPQSNSNLNSGAHRDVKNALRARET